MLSTIVSKILDRIGQPELVRILRDLSGTALNSILLEVFNERTSRLTPPQILNLYQVNRFVKPAELPVLKLKQTELELLKLFKEYSFEPMELSPVAILGSCSVVAPADQRKILSALRGTEVLADATNSIALHISDLKQRKVWMPKTGNEKLRFSTFHRHLRTQPITGKGFTPHFKIGCLVTSGLDTGSFTFEKEALNEQVTVMKMMFENYYNVDQLSFRLVCRKGYADSIKLANDVKEFIRSHQPETRIQIIENPETEIGYYNGIQYKVDIQIKGESFEIGDGGFTDWTQQLMQNKKERMLIAGFGFEFMYRIVHGLW